MALPNSFIGQDVIVRDAQDIQIAKSTITAHDRHNMSIDIDTELPEAMLNTYVSILMFPHDTSPVEYRGLIRKIVSSRTTISIFKGEELPGRGAKRYTINAPAVIDAVMLMHRRLALSVPLDINIINISTSGMLFSSEANLFGGVNSVVCVQLFMNGHLSGFVARIVRTKPIDGGKSFEFACKFVQ